MALHFFTIPILSSPESETKLNKFIAQHQIINIEKYFVADSGNSFWSICVTSTLLDKGAKLASTHGKRKIIDYKEVLSADDFVLYSELRVLRKEFSDAEGIPAYAVFTNEQLSKIVTNKVEIKADLEKIEGIGEARLEKYADQFIDYLKTRNK